MACLSSRWTSAINFQAQIGPGLNRDLVFRGAAVFHGEENDQGENQKAEKADTDSSIL